MITNPPIALNDVDRRIWEEELEGYVPRDVFDVHTHLYRWDHFRDPNRDESPYRPLLGETWAEANRDLADTVDAILMPGRRLHRLAFPFPFPHHCDFHAANDFLAEELSADPLSAGLLLVHPSMSAEAVEEQVIRYGYLGFKPYRFYSTSGDAVECNISDFMPEHQLAVANGLGLIVMMHLARKEAIADPRNQRELVSLCERYSNVRWILAHCARGYSDWAINRAAPVLRELPNTWYDTSSVCESDAILALLRTVGPDRVMYGSDDIPVGVLRGKYVTFGYAWAYLGEHNHSLDLCHCESRMSFTRYEQLRAMRRAADALGLTPEHHRLMFHDTAVDLVASVRSSLRKQSSESVK
jgi:predicted TIM-barrel fold metal-dependent hydrolase